MVRKPKPQEDRDEVASLVGDQPGRQGTRLDAVSKTVPCRPTLHKNKISKSTHSRPPPVVSAVTSLGFLHQSCVLPVHRRVLLTPRTLQVALRLLPLRGDLLLLRGMRARLGFRICSHITLGGGLNTSQPRLGSRKNQETSSSVFGQQVYS